jgi:predicted dehydrogenase
MLTRRDVLAAAVAAPYARLRPYRACIIGNTRGGGYGHGLDLAFQKITGIRVTAVADPDEAGAKAAAGRAGAERTYADWRAMLRQEKPNLVSIGPRWVVERVEMIRAAAEIGAHVVMEKPLARSLADADAIVEAAERAGIKIALAHQARVAPSVNHLKKLVGDGLIGDLLEIRTRGKEDGRAGGEDLMVLGWHCLYLMRAFAGEPLWCSARVLQDGRDVTREDRRRATEPLGAVAGNCIQATYAFAGGLQGFFASQKGRPSGRFEIALLGTKGVVQMLISADPVIRWLDDPLWAPGKTGVAWKPLPGAPGDAEPSGLTGAAAANKRLVEDLLRAIETGGESVAGAREGRAVLEMIHAVYAAHLAGARVAFPLRDRAHPLGEID